MFGFPTLVRFSWKTCKDLIAQSKESNIDWMDPKLGESDKENEK